ncbi:MAG: helix-turn-helix domain-containing protein [Bacteroidia bacterium]|nr:helix-turn-helix domain-containing protein [Bacteroidia bacterium]
MKNKPVILTHDFYSKLEGGIPFQLIELSAKSNYDALNYHRHSYYEIFLFIKGGGVHDIDFDSFEVKDNSLQFVSPGQIHMLQRALDSTGYIILFSREFYQLGLINEDTLYEFPFLNNNTPYPVIEIPDDKMGVVIDLFKSMRTEYNSEGSDKEQALRAYLNVLFLEAKRIHKNQYKDLLSDTKPHSNNDLVKRFRVAIEKHFVVHHKPGDYADILCVTTGHLNDVVQNALGTTASKLISDRLMLEIKRMLMHSNDPVNDIASQLHFDDVSYFSKFFKNQTGLSPLEYRKSIRQHYYKS